MNILIIVACLIAAIILRTQIADVLVGIRNHAQITWINFTVDVWPVIRRRSLMIVGVNLLIVTAVGIYANSFWSAITASIAFPIWFMSLISIALMSEKHKLFPVVKVIKWMAIVVFVFSGSLLMLGLWSPSVKEGYDQWSDSKKEVLASFFKKSSFKASAEADMIVTLNDRSEIYDNEGRIIRRGEEILRLKKGVAVKACEKRPSGDKSEALVKVMIENPAGSFVGGRIVYVPSRKINWNQS